MIAFILMIFVNGYDAQFGLVAEFETAAACQSAGLQYQRLAQKTHSYAKEQRVGFICVKKQ